MMSLLTKNIRWLYEKLAGHFYKRDPQVWVFGEWMGNRCCDNSLALANYIAEKYPEIKLVWVAKKGADLSALSKQVTRAEWESPEAKKLLKHAGVVVMNQGLVDFCEEPNYSCSGAVTVQLWHGVPWKKIGLDGSHEEGLHKVYSRYLAGLARADMHLALSDEFADIMESAFLAEREGIVLTGYPRNALFYDPDRVRAAQEKVIGLLGDRSLDTDTLKIITYMPTFRDKTTEVFSFESLGASPRLNQMLEEHNAVIIQKAHFVSYQRDSSANQVSTDRILTLNDIAAQELLAATDLLITDYSSCFFDYLVLDRPIIHYLYDYQYYAGEDRGVYYKAGDVVCGDAPENVEQLLGALESNLRNPARHRDLRQIRRNRFMHYESAESCEIIYQSIMTRLK